jgi:hypothetical protein
MQSACLCWGREADSIVQLEETLRLVGRGGRCAQVIVAADVLYRPESTEWLAQTLRDLIGRGGCTHVVLSWRDRGGDEEEFLSRLSDLGTAKVVWAVSGEGIRKKGVNVLTVGELQHPAI